RKEKSGQLEKLQGQLEEELDRLVKEAQAREETSRKPATAPAAPLVPQAPLTVEEIARLDPTMQEQLRFRAEMEELLADYKARGLGEAHQSVMDLRGRIARRVAAINAYALQYVPPQPAPAAPDANANIVHAAPVMADLP